MDCVSSVPKIFMRLALVLLASTLLLVSDGCSSDKQTAAQKAATDASSPLKVGIIPFEGADALQKGFAPFASYLAKKAGRPSGEPFVANSYAGVIQALQSDQIDVAYLNPLSYVLAVEQFKNTPEHIVPIAMYYFHNSLTYKGEIFVRTDSGIKSIKDLKGKSVAFGDQTSTSGYLYPLRLMKRAGLEPNKDFKAVNVGGTASVISVYNGQAAAGAIYEGGLEVAFTDQRTQKVDEDKVKQFLVLAKTDPIANGMIVVRGNLDPATIDKLKKAMVDINTDPDGKAALKAIPDGGWDKMVPPDDKIFDPVREQAKILGLNLSSLDEKAGKKP